ncbi:MAG: hypothetical protein AMJ76_01830 [Dehalococcoidia bacterium SM23_28_1]|nr:MAG: hypothetical protein AMJ76_01830 [Dehalococcoidia bacterium SM23_28_1]
MTRALAFSLPFLGARAARACLCRFGRCWTTRSCRFLRGLLLLQDLLGSQVVFDILALGSPILLPKAMSQLPYLLFRRHDYLPHEELMRDDEALSSFCGAFEGHFPAGMEAPISTPPRSGGDQQGRKPCQWRVYPLHGTMIVNSYWGGSS